MHLLIRSFNFDDYLDVQELLKAAVPEVEASEEQIRNYYENHNPILKFQRWVGIFNERVVAYGLYDQISSKEFLIYGVVHPNYQSKGIGSALYNHIIVALTQFNPLSVQAYARENRSSSVEFLRTRGFQEAQQDQSEWSLLLDVASFDSTPFAGIEEDLQDKGIKIKTLEELKTELNYDHKLNKLFNELRQDIPLPRPSTLLSYDYFIANLLNDPNQLSDAYFVAVKGKEYIGMNVLHKQEFGFR